MVEMTSSSGFLSLLETLEDSKAGQSEQTDAYLTIANRLSGEEGRQFLPAVEMHFSRLGKIVLTHITSPNAELSQAALQALGFCVYHQHVVSGVPENLASNILSALCSLVVDSTDKNTCTRALWVISKQSFPSNVVAKKVASILSTLEKVWSRKDMQSVIMEHESLNVVVRMLEQVPAQMGEGAVRWARLVIPLVVHSASKVRLRAAAAMEMGLPLLLEKQLEVAAVIEPMMSAKLIPELQKLFTSKNETNVLKLWPLFVKLLGKLLHKGGPFINSLLHLEELGFRSSSPPIKKIAFIAWKSLIDNFALKPEILCNAKRLKLLMQPLISIHVRTEALLLTKVEVWWYLVVRLGPNLASNFEQVSVPLLQCTFGSDSSTVPVTTPRVATQSGTTVLNSSTSFKRMSLNTSVSADSSFPSIQLLGLEMLLHYFLGPDIVATAATTNLALSLEPLNHPFLSGTSSFTKHAAVLISSIKDGFISVGNEAPADSLLALVWMSLVSFVSSTIESAGSKKDSHGCEALTLTLQALQSIVTSEALPADRVLGLFETTIKGIPVRVLGSASYQVGKMDVLNGTPALFLILLLYNSSRLATYVEDERFFECLHTLVGCGLSGPTSPLAFGEAVLGAIRSSTGSLQNKEQLWRMWNMVVIPLIDTITQSNEVNQGDALEHNFSAVHSALMFPISHLLRGTPLQQASQKPMLSTWSKLYRVFARCSALVVTAEENVCCEELCAKMVSVMDREALTVPSILKAFTSILQVMVECVDFSPYRPQFQQKHKSPHTPLNWMRKKNKALGNLSTFQSLLVQSLEVFLAAEEPESLSEATGGALISILSTLFTNLVLATAVREALASLIQPLTLLYKQAASQPPKFPSQLLTKLEKLLGDVLSCLQTRSALVCDDELLTLLSPLLCVLFPHKNKQHRIAVAQFWNATFGNLTRLTYPEELRPILSQVKQNTPIILPGFEAFSVSDDLSGLYSSESSRLEPTISGMQITPVVKRDSLLGKAAEWKDESSKGNSRPISIKLDFGSPKPLRREVLEEEASIDFVFIPPETKERVLTEHQKEVKRTKRVDIPAMYNNLDASLDTAVFSQYTQSQEDSMETEEADGAKAEIPNKVSQEDMENRDDPEVLTKVSASQNAAENSTKDTENSEQKEIPKTADAKSDEDVEMEAKENVNISGSSDLVSGTPQKPTSRRQSFFTLEMYAEGKPVTPSNVSTFTGPLMKTSSHQEQNTTLTTSSSQESQTATSTKPQVSQSSDAGEVKTHCSVGKASEFSQMPEAEPEEKNAPEHSVTETEDEDVIPDTQTDVEDKESPSSVSQGEESQDDSQSSVSTSPSSEPRRSSRQRTRPLLPGEDAEERKEKFAQVKRRRSGEESKRDSPYSTIMDRPNTRSKQAAEEEDHSRKRLRTRSLVGNSESSQTSPHQRKTKSYSSSKELLGKHEPKRRDSKKDENSQNESQSDTQSDYDSHLQTKQSQQSKSPLGPEEEGRKRKKGRPLKKKRERESSQNASVEITESPSEKHKAGDSSKVLGGLEEVELMSQNRFEPNQKDSQTHDHSQDSERLEQISNEKDDIEPSQKDSQIASPPEPDSQSPIVTPPQTDRESQVFELVELANNDKDELEPSQKDSWMASPPEVDSQALIVTPPQTDDQSESFEVVEQIRNKKEVEPSQKDSQIITPTADGKSHTRTSIMSDSDELIKDKHDKREATDDKFSQQYSQETTLSASDSQTRRRSQRTKASSEAVESQDKTESEDSARRQSRRSSQETPSAASQTEDRVGGRTRRNKAQGEQLKSTLTSASESSQSLDQAGSTESSKGRGRYSRRRSSQALASNTESPKSGESKANKAISEDNSESSQNIQTTPISRPLKTRQQRSLKDKLAVSESPEATSNIKERSKEEAEMEVDRDVSVGSESAAPGNAEGENSKPLSEPEQKQTDSETKLDIGDHASQERDARVLQAPEAPESDDISTEKIQEKPSCDVSMEISISCNIAALEPTHASLSPVCSGSSVDTPLPSSGTTEELSLSESSEETVVDVAESVQAVTESQKEDSDHQEHPNVEDKVEDNRSLEQTQTQCSDATDELSKEEQFTCIQESKSMSQDTKAHTVEHDIQENDENVAPPQENKENDNVCDMECEDEEEDQLHSISRDVDLQSDASESTCNDVCQVSPVKQKDLEAATGSDVSHSPSSARPKGTWSPSASPSTSILKKGQKRPLMDETPSPVVKSRRVSFANPIQQQELADDIDRRSPALRTSSPRRSKTSISQPKLVTTPTKALLFFSPRSLHASGNKSSKKCLISEMSQESRPVPRDCIYPTLVGCMTPVEAVLPQISSNMWSRGLGQLVRARNIKTIGDLSALPPSEIKTLPVRSPKIFNVKKALQIYEQQHKGQGGDELKSFEEMERMTSELEDPSTPQHLGEEKSSNEPLATELEDEPAPAERWQEQDVSTSWAPDEGPLSEVEALISRLTPQDLSRFSPQQLGQLHERLGGVMRLVVAELQSRLCQTAKLEVDTATTG
ncbi:hypothetical protein LDENG_00103970 [Lucifuga dentata]|nr:hypothetical protein LDENG_00103970 [Lucifuga dentata]